MGLGLLGKVLRPVGVSWYSSVRHQATAAMKWNKEVNMVVTECFYRSKPFENGEIEG